MAASVGETGSNIWALKGSSGATLLGFPVSLPKSVVASSSALIVDLHTCDYYSLYKEKMTPGRFVDRMLPVTSRLQHPA